MFVAYVNSKGREVSVIQVLSDFYLDSSMNAANELPTNEAINIPIAFIS